MNPTRREFLRGAKDLAVTASPAGRVLNKAGSLLTKPVTRKVGVYLTDNIVGDHQTMMEYNMGVMDIPVEKKTGLYNPKYGGRGGPDHHEIEYKRPELKDPHLEFRSINSKTEIGSPQIHTNDSSYSGEEKIGEIDVPDIRFVGDVENFKVEGDVKKYIADEEIYSYQMGDSDYGYKKFRPEQIKSLKSVLSKGRKLYRLYEEAQRVKSLYDNTEGKPKQIVENPEKPKKTPVQKRIEHSTKQRTALAQKPSSGIPWGDVIRVGISRLSGIGAGLELASYISPGGSTGDATLENWYKKNGRKSPIQSSGSR
jgi:hypothetical protein